MSNVNGKIYKFKPKESSNQDCQEEPSDGDDDKIDYMADLLDDPDEDYLDFLKECYQKEYQKIDQLAYDDFTSKNYIQAYGQFEVNLKYCKNDIERYHTAIMMGLSARLYSKKWYKKMLVKKWLAKAEEAFLNALSLCGQDKELIISAMLELGINHLERFKSSNDSRYLEEANIVFERCHKLLFNSKNNDARRRAICESFMGETLLLLDNKNEAIEVMKSAHKILKGLDDKYEFDNLSRLSQASNLYKFVYYPRRMMLYVRQNF